MARKRQRRKDARPQEIIEAAMRVFSRDGFAAAKVESIAAEAEIAKGTLYLYFSTKQALFEGAVRQAIAPVFATARSSMEAIDGSASERLETVIRHIYANLVQSDERRAIVQVLISEGSRFPQLTEFYHNEILAGAKAMLREIIRNGISSGEFRPDVQAVRHPEILMGPAMLAAIWKNTFDHVSPLNIGPYIDAHIDLVLHGLRSTRD